MIYTGNSILSYLYTKLSANNLMQTINGKLYKRGTRQPDSKKEDAVIAFLAGTSSQVQEGDVVLNVYVPNLKGKDGVDYCDIVRCQQIEQMLVDIPDWLTKQGDIKFETNGMICTIEEPNINQHFVSLKMRFKVLTSKF